jgi:hypothetical protein
MNYPIAQHFPRETDFGGTAMQSPERIGAASAGIAAYCRTGVETPLDYR